MDISAIIAEWGALYRAGMAGQKDLMTMLMQGSETESLFPLLPTDSTILEKTSAKFSPVVQSFQKKFTAKNGTEFTPRKVELQWLKIDASEYPDELVKSWLGFLAGEQLDRKEWPFVKWWLQGLMKQQAEDIEKDEIFYGVPAAIVDGVASASGTNMLGIRKQLNDGETAGDVVALAMGAVPADPVDFVEYIETMYYDIEELLRNELDGFQMSKTLAQRFKEGMREKYNMNYKQAGDLATIIDTNVPIRGLVSHAGSDKIWATPKWNRVRGVKNGKNESVFRLYSIHREVFATTDYHKGVGFWIPEYVVTNGQDTDE